MGFDDDLMNMDGECMEELGTPLPGFRFHPTDEELVGFYLRRKLDKKPITLQLIKQIDIYKYDPWDLPSIHLFSYNNIVLLFLFLIPLLLC